ncbi:MAG: hypothetical protein KA533_02470 [Sphingobium sp.]|nr:hypothetical protein [Sphingobium sp.]MBP6113077.1 hypothetical protein [Sphingobium sp.]MBP8672206.1 hypothetical protein [Sphingobium sp.]MBP9156340.1 hypothetical protein [Sphingobium sp.]
MSARPTIVLREHRDRPGSLVVLVEPRTQGHQPKFFHRADAAEAFAEKLRDQTGFRLYNALTGTVR